MKLTEQSANRHNLQASAQVPKSTQVDLYIAIYESGLRSRINAGENSGRELKHDYVVREFFGPYRFQNTERWERTFPLNGNWLTRDGGVAIFVQNRDTGEVLQALALDFCS
jgi:hypothetical protein